MKKRYCFLLLLLALLSGCTIHKIAVGDGLLLKSPNGTRYEVTIDDNGQTSTMPLPKH